MLTFPAIRIKNLYKRVVKERFSFSFSFFLVCNSPNVKKTVSDFQRDKPRKDSVNSTQRELDLQIWTTSYMSGYSCLPNWDCASKAVRVITTHESCGFFTSAKKLVISYLRMMLKSENRNNIKWGKDIY